MLPFLNKKRLSAGLVSSYKSEGKLMPEDKPEEKEDSLLVAAEDLIGAVKAGDAQGVAQALRAAFELCDMEPHVEGPHLKEGA